MSGFQISSCEIRASTYEADGMPPALVLVGRVDVELNNDSRCHLRVRDWLARALAKSD